MIYNYISFYLIQKYHEIIPRKINYICLFVYLVVDYYVLLLVQIKNFLYKSKNSLKTMRLRKKEKSKIIYQNIGLFFPSIFSQNQLLRLVLSYKELKGIVSKGVKNFNICAFKNFLNIFLFLSNKKFYFYFFHQFISLSYLYFIV